MNRTKRPASKAAVLRPGLVITAKCALIAVAVALPSFVGAQQGAVDLNGNWKTSDGQEVSIEQSGQNVKATFLSGGDCPSGGQRDFYLQGSLSGNSLTGTMKRCTRNQQLLQDCKLIDPYIANITATVDQNTITGKYVGDYVTYDQQNGHYTNCKVRPGEAAPGDFSLTRSGPASASKPTSEARAEVKTPAAETNAPPIITMTVASSIDDKGKLVNPRFTFPPTESQITAVVYVGKAGGGQLKVTWYKVSEDMDRKPFDEKLFEHQIQVKNNERAYSVAKNPGGTLELGRYKVVATLEGQTKETQFDVSAPKRPNRISNRPEDELFENEARSQGISRALSVGSNAGGLRTASSHDWSNDSEPRMKKAAWNASSLTKRSQMIAFQSAQQGQRPVAGTSGTVPQSASAPAASGAAECEVEIDAAFRGGDIWPYADQVWINSRAMCGKSYWEHKPSQLPWFVLTATKNGSTQAMGTVDPDWEVGQWSLTRDFYINPCSFSEPSDLPGTKITVKASTPFQINYTPVERTITLGDDTMAPSVNVVPTPERGSLVKAGDKIKLQVTAEEKRGGLLNGSGSIAPWQTGVRRIWLKATPEGSFDKEPEWNNPSRLPKPCDQKTWTQDFKATYTVPKNPPPIIEICAYAYDYGPGSEGNERSNCADFATGEWEGKIKETVQGNIYNNTATILFGFTEERDGTLKGAGRVRIENKPQVFSPGNGCTFIHKYIRPEALLFPISGRRVGDEFHLELPSDYRLRGSAKAYDCPDPRNDRDWETIGARTPVVTQFGARPKVKAKDGASNSWNDDPYLSASKGYQVNGTIEIHRTKP